MNLAHDNSPRGDEALTEVSRSEEALSTPWAEVIDHIPSEFVLSRDGLFRDGVEYVAAPCWIAGETRSADHDDAGVVINWVNHIDDSLGRLSVPKRRFHEQGAQLIQLLVGRGLHVIPTKERLLLRYLGSFRLPSTFLKTSTSQVGWTEFTDGTAVFATPNGVIGQAGPDDRVVLQGAEEYRKSFRAAGSLEQWQKQVFGRCKNHPFMAFPIYASLAAPLLKLTTLDSGGFHFFGSSSKGKTTMLQAGTSVWGNGSDPAVSHDALMCRWNSTANAFEATAAAYNDVLLALDELGTSDVKDVGKVTYDLFGGRGKARMSRDSSLRDIRSWRILGLSTGEISLREKVKELSGRPAHLGQQIRLADVPIPSSGVLDPLLVDDPAAEIDAIKKSSGRYYGTAGASFVERLLCRHADKIEPGEHLTFAKLSPVISGALARTEAELSDGLVIETHHQRVLRRLALVAMAGCLAVELGVLPEIPRATILHSVGVVRDAWLNDDENIPEDIRGVNAVRSFILLNDDRFRAAKNEDEVVHRRVGYRTLEPSTSNMLYLFEGTGFDQVCREARCDPKRVLQVLKTRNLLFMNDQRLKSRHQIAGIGRSWFYAVRAKIVEQH